MIHCHAFDVGCFGKVMGSVLFFDKVRVIVAVAKYGIVPTVAKRW